MGADKLEDKVDELDTAARPLPKPAELSGFCRKHHIRKLSVFGSVLREDFGPASDVDVLVEYKPGHRPGLVRLHEIEQELSRVFGGRKVDLVNPKFLNSRIRDRVLAQAEVLFAEG